MHKKPTSDKKIASRIRTPSRSQTAKQSGKFGKKPSSINELLANRPILQRLAAAIPAQQSWTGWLREQLSPELAPHIINVVPKNGQLVVFADSAAWSARLRYALADIAAQISERDAAICRTQVRVQMP